MSAHRWFCAGLPCVALIAALHVLLLPGTAGALGITFDSSLTITDNSLWDLNPAIGTIQFDSTVTFPGALASGYDVKGTVQQGGGPALSAIISPVVDAVTLTNFVADSPIGAPGGPLDIEFYDTFAGGPYPTITAADVITALVGNGNGSLPFNQSALSNAVPAGTDTLIYWQGFVSGAITTSPFGGPLPINNPALAAGGGTAPYTVYGHGPTIIPSISNPVVGAFLTFQLGATRDQFILPSSAEVGFTVTPEPSSLLLATMGLIGLAIYRRRKSRQTDIG
jgi:hypothetical protein